jgi:hypothetical protein
MKGGGFQRPRPAFVIHQQEIDSLRVDAPVSFRISATKNFAERDLSHHLPGRIERNHDTVEFLEDARFALVENRLDREVRTHDNSQLISRIPWAL